ncbi:MAG: bifunctional ornithine acetyltransferase/N-acetylglutamate synthase [Bacteroidales bacterium]|nr:bifunctional ornithine acetyltransferase/N-acetylglutamate synthase [Bacteroidales bacterium]
MELTITPVPKSPHRLYDGEGALEIDGVPVSKSNNDSAAKLVRAVSDSLLVKTAMFGRDPNWGRLLLAARMRRRQASISSTVPIGITATEPKLGGRYREKGAPKAFDRNQVKKLLRESHLRVHLEMNQGKAEATGWGSDITTDCTRCLTSAQTDLICK